MSRTRLIRPEFFSDETMARASVATRLFYIGLWTLCDDAGFFELVPAQIAAELFRYEPRGRREKMTAKSLLELSALDRVRFLECGEHAIVPTIPDHRIKGGEPLFTVKKRHERRCSVVVRSPTSDSISVSVSDSGSVSVSNDAQARTRKLRDAALAVGGFIGNHAAAKA